MKIPAGLRAWRASFVRRWHTNFDLCDSGDYISGHQQRVALLILSLFPHASRSLLIEAIIHDQGEAGSCDCSYDAKAAMPVLRNMLAEAEGQELIRQGLEPQELQEWEAQALKLCDRLDAWLWMMRHARHLFIRADWLKQRAEMMELAGALNVGSAVYAIVDAEERR